MPRYLFHVVGAEDRYADDEGTDLPDLNAAKEEARKDARDFRRARFQMLSGDWSDWAIEICDSDGKLLDTVPFHEPN